MEKDKKKPKGLALGAVFQTINTDIESKSIPYQPNTVSLIAIQNIEVNPYQPRNEFNAEQLQELANSIQQHGLIQPITVRHLGGENFQLISGERRLRACRLAKIEQVPAFIRTANDEQMIEMALIENIQRQDLDPIEVAITYSRLKEECKLTDEVLSDRVGKKRSTVTNYMGLLKLPYDIQEGLRANLLSMGHARALIGLHDFALQSALYKEIITKGLSVRQVEELAAGYGKPKERKEAAPKLPQEYQAVQKRLVSALGAKVALKVDDKGKGQITVNFNDTEELNRLLELMEKDA